MIGLKTQLAERVLHSDPDRAHQELAEIRAITSDALAEVRRTVHDLRAPSLAEELERVRTALAAAGIGTEAQGSATDAPPRLDSCLSWVIRECATNTLRHAEATRVRIEIDQHRLTFETTAAAPPPLKAVESPACGVASPKRTARSRSVQRRCTAPSWR